MENHAAPDNGTQRIPRTIGEICRRLVAIPDDAGSLRRQAEFERRVAYGYPGQQWRECCRGKRYEECTLEQFDTSYGRLQRDAVQKIEDFIADMRGHVRTGRNVILYGPSGTGKDHLLACMLHAACDAGIRCTWTTGPAMAMAFRAAFDGDDRETDVLKQHTKPAVLAISDPILSGAKLTAYQEHMLYQAIDDRYSECRATWITCNAANRAEMEEGIGVAVVDRLRDNALVIHCDWPSYRKARPL